jgi:uncharacterized membrane protein
MEQKTDSDGVSRLLAALPWLLLVALFAWSIIVYPELPARIPEHFAIDGEVDRWTSTTWISWLALPFVGVFLAFLLSALARYLPMHPEQLNMPQKKRFLALPPEAQRSVAERVGSFFHTISIMVTLVFASIQIERYQAAIGSGGRTGVAIFLLIALALPVGIVWHWISIRRQIERFAAEAQGSPGAG